MNFIKPKSAFDQSAFAATRYILRKSSATTVAKYCQVFYFLGEMSVRRFAHWDRLGHVRSFDAKSQAPRISGKLFDLEAPDFTGPSIPTLSIATTTPDITSLPTSGRKL